MKADDDAAARGGGTRASARAAPVMQRSIRQRLLRAQALALLLLAAAAIAGALLVVRQEVDELLDDALQSTAQGLLAPLAGSLLRDAPAGGAPDAAAPPAVRAVSGGVFAEDSHEVRFVWQIVGPGPGREAVSVLAGSAGAPAQPLLAAPVSGFANVPGWRVFGHALGGGSRMLYVAQSTQERQEVQTEMLMGALLATLPLVLLGLWWSNARMRHELEPLQALSRRLQAHDPLQAAATLGPSTHRELQPVHDAIDALAARLASRVAQERAFSAHAAHALRTPLAGIDAQLAVALRETTPELRPRLARVRSAAARLQHVVAALLTLFRSGAELQRLPQWLPQLVSRVPIEGLHIDFDLPAGQVLRGDADLLTAALLNLLDNCVRHGGRQVRVSMPTADSVRLDDDGLGVSAERRAALQQALDEQDYASRTGLGLMLADLVARAHGGRLVLPPVAEGFAVELRLAPD